MRLAYQVVGHGPVDLVCVPGFVSHLDLMPEVPGYSEFFERLASLARVALYDKRGTGLSDRTGHFASLDEQAIDLEAVMGAAGMDRAVLFGWSEGAAISTVFAATRRDRVESLVLYGGTARVPWGPDYDVGLDPESAAPHVRALREAWGQDSDDLANALFPDSAHDAVIRRTMTRAFRAAMTSSEVKSFVRYILELDYRHVLPTVGVPTLVVHRSGDLWVPVGIGRYLADSIPGARYVELPGGDHPPWLGDPRRLADEIEAFVTGRVSSPPSDRVLATVMFTDIVGSTQRAADLGDERWRAILRAHDRTAQRQVERHRGRFVKSTGDGFLAHFDLPGAAIRCAQDTAGEVASLGISIRAGLHTGEIELLGDDVGGLGVHLAARVADAATVGEILVTSTVKDLVAGAGFGFEPRGEREFKGVPGSWATFAVAT
jgi:class 3 adenylate cyclase